MIAIVALLIALVLPAIRNMRDRGAMAQCQSNLRQAGGLVLLYASSNDGYLPVWRAQQDAWYQVLQRAGLSSERGNPAFYCPVTPKNGVRGRGQFMWTNPDYGLNIDLTQYGRGADAVAKTLASIPRPAQTVMMAETGNLGGNPDAPLGGDYRFFPTRFGFVQNGPMPFMTDYPNHSWLCFRHPRPGPGFNQEGGSAHVLFFDGHVEALVFDDPRLHSQEDRSLMFLGDPDSIWAPSL